MAILEELPPGARILVVRLRSLGDCVLTTPALRLLKSTRPDCRVGVVAEPRFADVFRGNPDVDAILDAAPLGVARFSADLAVNFHGGPRSAALTAFSRARWRAGFAHFRAAWVYNIRIPAAQQILAIERKVHTAEHMASAVFFLGAQRAEIPRARLFADPEPASRPYAVIHAAASAPRKTWPAENFAGLARHLSQCGLDPVFIGAASDDLAPFREFRCLQGAPLARVKSLLAGASLFLGNDSGPAHMAAAFGLPVVVLFGSSDPVIWAPWCTPHQILSSPEGIGAIPVAEAIRAIEQVRVKA